MRERGFEPPLSRRTDSTTELRQSRAVSQAAVSLSLAVNQAGRISIALNVSLGTAPDGSLKVAAGPVLSFLTTDATVDVTTSGGKRTTCTTVRIHTAGPADLSRNIFLCSDLRHLVRGIARQHGPVSVKQRLRRC